MDRNWIGAAVVLKPVLLQKVSEWLMIHYPEKFKSIGDARVYVVNMHEYNYNQYIHIVSRVVDAIDKCVDPYYVKCAAEDKESRRQFSQKNDTYYDIVDGKLCLVRLQKQ